MTETKDKLFYYEQISLLKNEVARVIVGQEVLIEKMLIALLCRGHVLLEGVPGLAKTLLIKTIADSISASFHRIQFTPDLLPADITGTLIFDPKEVDFKTKKGPIFANIILADEINRSPAKVQSALLEAMMEKQVTIGDQSYKLADPFLVLATQNPIEQEGTYPLPEAQLDRFIFKLQVEYPSFADEVEIVRRNSAENKISIQQILKLEDLIAMQRFVESVYIDDKILEYMVTLVFATRTPGRYDLGDYINLIQFGASPRASIFIAKAARAKAFLNGRDFVLPEDIHGIIREVLRHRVILSYEAAAENISVDDIVEKIIQAIEVP